MLRYGHERGQLQAPARDAIADAPSGKNLPLYQIGDGVNERPHPLVVGLWVDGTG